MELDDDFQRLNLFLFLFESGGKGGDQIRQKIGKSSQTKWVKLTCFQASGRVHGQHIHQPTFFRLQPLDFRTKVDVLILQSVGFLHKYAGPLLFAVAAFGSGDFVPLTSPATAFFVFRRQLSHPHGIPGINEKVTSCCSCAKKSGGK